MDKRETRGERREARDEKSKFFSSFICIYFLIFFFCLLSSVSFAQQSDDLEFTLDVNSSIIPLPKIFQPNIDLSGRGFNRDANWPQNLAAKEAIGVWGREVGFGGLCRIQYNLQEISLADKDKQGQVEPGVSSQSKLLANYESVIKIVSDNGSTVILNLFGTPAEFGNDLNKLSLPQNLLAYKQLVKGIIRNLSCEKKYNIWYEVWNAPDLEDFFPGRRQDYFNLYRAVSEAILELEQETKINIPLGGPSSSIWFQNLEQNTILTPEKSLIYELIKYCYTYRLPLDFILWHAYSTDPLVDNQPTIYNKSSVELIREWLGYFHFDPKLPLIIDEWNFDRFLNFSPERWDKSHVGASFIPSRLNSMFVSGVDQQVYFCLEDFQIDKEGLRRNLGAFSFDSESSSYKGKTKAALNVFKMLGYLGPSFFPAKFFDEFVGILPAKSPDTLALLIYNYIDPDISANYLSRNIVSLNAADRKTLLNLVNSERLDKIFSGQINFSTLRLSGPLKGIFNKALELGALAKKYSVENRKIKVNIKGYKDIYLYSRYVMDAACSQDCAFVPAEEKEIDMNSDQQLIDLAPYSVQLLVFKKKPELPPITAADSMENVVKEGKDAKGK